MPSKKRRKQDRERCMDDPYYRMWVRQQWVTRLWNMRTQLVVYHADDHLKESTLIEVDGLLMRLIHILKGL